MSRIPLLSHAFAEPFAWHRGQKISRRAFLGDVYACAASLPKRKYVLNRCEDRYLFLVGFAAAMLRDQVTLCPPALTKQFIGHLRTEFSDMYCLTDDQAVDGLPTVTVGHHGIEHDEDLVPDIAAQQTVLIAFTSGSTGTPARHPKTWQALVRGVARQSAMFGIQTSRELGVVATVPAQHMYGLESSLIMPLQMGWAIHGGKPFFPYDIAVALQQNSARNVLVTTPFHLRTCVESRIALPQLEFILSATAPLSAQLAAQAEQQFLVPVREIYGCTETGSIASRRTVEGSTWQLHEGITLSFEDNRCFAHGAHSLEPTPLQDIISPQDQNRFMLKGRVQDLVNIAGKRASLADLNHTLVGIAGVRDGVFFMPEGPADSVTRLVAFVVAPGCAASDILDALRARLDPAFVPRRLFLVDALPRNDTGKLPVDRLNALVEAGGADARALT